VQKYKPPELWQEESVAGVSWVHVSSRLAWGSRFPAVRCLGAVGAFCCGAKQASHLGGQWSETGLGQRSPFGTFYCQGGYSNIFIGLGQSFFRLQSKKLVLNAPVVRIS
jgi:hypothetical protein